MKLALVVGVNSYTQRGFSDLRHAENDARELAAELQTQGFTVVRLLGSDAGADRATRANVLARLLTLLRGANKSAVVLVSLSGHGQQLRVPTAGGGVRDDAFFCPVDAVLNDPASQVSLSHLIDEVLATRGGKNLLLVDACRDKPADPNRGGKGVQGGSVALPENTAVLFSCRAGQQSFEDVRAKADGGLEHGLFTHCVLDGLRTRLARDGELTWGGLVQHVEDRMAGADMRALVPDGKEQEPIHSGNVGRTLLARAVVKVPVPKPVDRGTTLDLGGGVTMEYVRVPAGEFEMGSPESDKEAFDDEKPRHRVRITKAFGLGACEVTRGQFGRFVADTEAQSEAERDGEGGWGYDAATDKWEGRKPQYTWKSTGWPQTDGHPVVNVTWNDAQAFCALASLKAGRAVRLPSEAEWDYACRGGADTKYSTGDEPASLEGAANVAGQELAGFGPAKGWTLFPFGDGERFTAAVGKRRANRFGLHDMHGNVWEWCEDSFDGKYYATSPVSDPVNSSVQENKVLRGGSWNANPRFVRAADRFVDGASNRYDYVGFRVAVRLD